MQRTRADFDFDRTPELSPTPHETETNRFELRCGMCGGALFVDRWTYDRLNAAFEQGMEDNPLLCAECELEFDDERAAS